MIPPAHHFRQESAIRNSRRSSANALIALPVYNEFRHVEDVLRAVQRYARNILVVNDGSTDGTGPALEKYPRLRLITHDVNAGYGRSLIDAFAYARTHRFEWVITMDCDHQHQPSHIPHFLREMRRNDADIISGSRYLLPLDLGSMPPPPERIAINREITCILNRLLGIGLTDAFCGFKAYRTTAVCGLELTEAGYGLPLQLWIQAQRVGLRIREIPVPLIYHDPKRNFCGALEDPQRRRAYYLHVLSQELGYDVTGEAEKSTRAYQERRSLYSS
jgi:glycosyltransferase involved in cell wall biosynthesis